MKRLFSFVAFALLLSGCYSADPGPSSTTAARPTLAGGSAPVGTPTSAPRPPGPEAIPGFIAALKSNNGIARSGAVTGLGRVGAPAVEPLRAFLKDTDATAEAKACAAGAVERIGRTAKDIVPDLIPLLNAKEDRLRSSVASALAETAGPEAKEVLPQLLAALEKDEESAVRAPVAKAIGALGVSDPAAVALLLKSLTDTNYDVRGSAAGSLGLLGGPMKAAVVPALTEALQDGAESVRISAALALRQLEPNSAPALQALMAVLKSSDPFARRAAAQALGRLGPAVKDATPALTALLKDHEATVREAAAEALKRVAGEKE